MSILREAGSTSEGNESTTSADVVTIKGKDYSVGSSFEDTLNGIRKPALSTDMVHSMDNAQVHIQLSGGGYFVMYDYYHWDKHDSGGNIVSSGGFSSTLSPSTSWNCQCIYQNEAGVTLFVHGTGSNSGTYITVMSADGTLGTPQKPADSDYITAGDMVGNIICVFDTVLQKFVLGSQSYFNNLTNRIEVDPITGAVVAGTSYDFADNTNLANMESPFLLAYAAATTDAQAYVLRNLYFEGKPELYVRMDTYHDGSYFTSTSRSIAFWWLKDAVHIVAGDDAKSYPYIQVSKPDYIRWMIETFKKAGGTFE